MNNLMYLEDFYQLFPSIKIQIIINEQYNFETSFYMKKTTLYI